MCCMSQVVCVDFCNSLAGSWAISLGGGTYDDPLPVIVVVMSSDSVLVKPVLVSCL